MANVSAIKDGETHRKEKIKVTAVQGLQRIDCCETNRRQWTNLPAELLREVLESLSLADQIRLSLICKTSRFLPLCDDRLVDRLPWLVSCGNSGPDGFVCKLFDFIQKKPYTTLRMTGPGMHSFRPDYVASKHGWLFFLREKGSYTAEMFLFCPYTKEIIMLPDLHHGVPETSEYGDKDRMRIVTFSSSDLKSQDCVIFVLYYIYDSFEGKLVTCSCKRGDKEWKAKVFDKALKVIRITNLVYLQGYLYCVNCDGTLGAYDVARQRWYVFNTCSADVANKHGRFHLIVSNGRLLLSTLDECWGYYTDSPRCKLFRMNWSEMEWFRIKELKHQALFLGHQPWDCSFAVPALIGDLGYVSNKIFHREGDNGMDWRLYDLNERKHHDCEGTEFEFFVPRKEESMDGMMWIEPPCHVLKPHPTESRENLSASKSKPNLSLARKWR